MAITIPHLGARVILEAALERAKDEAWGVSSEWTERTKEVGRAPSRTFTAALGTALLAKACDPRIDPLALKATDDPRAYSARNLCEKVLVPAAIEGGFDLGATGRQPLNNQPFFRYDRIDDMARVHPGAQAAHRRLVAILKEVDDLNARDASAALVAFLRERLAVAAEAQAADLRSRALGVRELVLATKEFVLEDPEGGRRGQALVAAVFDLAFGSVRMGRVNDPSRRFPGDVQVLDGTVIVSAAEVRQKPVSDSDAAQYAAVLRAAGVANGVMVALDPSQEPLDRDALVERAERDHGVLVTVVDSVEELFDEALLWCGRPLEDALEEFPQRMRDRLREIEVSSRGLAEWESRVMQPAS